MRRSPGSRPPGFIARKLLFGVGAHEGLKSGSETGRKGLRGKEGRTGEETSATERSKPVVSRDHAGEWAILSESWRLSSTLRIPNSSVMPIKLLEIYRLDQLRPLASEPGMSLFFAPAHQPCHPSARSHQRAAVAEWQSWRPCTVLFQGPCRLILQTWQ